MPSVFPALDSREFSGSEFESPVIALLHNMHSSIQLLLPSHFSDFCPTAFPDLPHLLVSVSDRLDLDVYVSISLEEDLLTISYSELLAEVY